MARCIFLSPFSVIRVGTENPIRNPIFESVTLRFMLIMRGWLNETVAVLYCQFKNCLHTSFFEWLSVGIRVLRRIKGLQSLSTRD